MEVLRDLTSVSPRPRTDDYNCKMCVLRRISLSGLIDRLVCRVPGLLNGVRA